MRRCIRSIRQGILSLALALATVSVASQEGYWNLKRYVIGPAPTLVLSGLSVNGATGKVEVNGWDTAQPTTPFTFSWGDGQSDGGWFPMRHTYQEVTRNYVVKVTAHYDDGTTDRAETFIPFVAETVDPVTLPSSLSVTFPDHPVTLVSHVPVYPPPTDLLPFDDSFFQLIPRATAEYVLTAAAVVLDDLDNGDHLLFDGGFQQVVLLDPDAVDGTGQAFFWTNPPAVGVSDEWFQSPFLLWAGFCHELAHNFHLRSPADYCFVDKMDGWSGYFFRESVARILQCGPAYELINDSERYGLGLKIPAEIGANTSWDVLRYRSSYDRYVSSGMHFCSWEDVFTPERETLDTACAIAVRFLVHAEEQGLGYRVPSKRMMKLIETFDQEALNKWDTGHDSATGATFRSTFMVTALSYAFQEDLRDEFRALNFPISDEDYEALWLKADTDPADFALAVTPTSLTVPRGRSVTCTIGTEALEGLTHEISFRARLAIPIERVSLALSDRAVEPGGAVTVTVTAEPDAPMTTSSIRLQAEGEYTAHAADIPVTVLSVPVIQSAIFDRKKTLTILGSGFGNAPRILVNSVDQTARIVSAYDATIVLSGKKKKLGLHAGANRLVVADSSGTTSAEHVLTL